MSTVVKRKDASQISSNGDFLAEPTGKEKKDSKRLKQLEKEERENLVLWKSPITTLSYSFRECGILLSIYSKRLLGNRKFVLLSLISSLLLYALFNVDGPHQKILQGTYKKILWCLYWIGLGILSSVGLGTGLHTFLLYLAPHIARVTLAAYECNSLNFPEPPYPDEIICPSDETTSYITLFSIMAKVRLESFCWGAGTALGELPPYFMARAARLSGIDPDDDDEELKEFEELQKKKKLNDLTLIERGKLLVEDVVQKIGFFGILACASIPNPLFDLAGITCGHFLVPFWTFFGATLIGKAFIKMHIQKMFIITVFSETLIDKVLEWIQIVPLIGDKLQTPFKDFFDGQRKKLHKRDAGGADDGKNFVGTIFELFVVAMILYFVVSIVNSFAQNYHKRIHKKATSKD